jgi:ABC-type nitrate/sulfonate/bicarbonate transport system substrate-binding protein
VKRTSIKIPFVVAGVAILVAAIAFGIISKHPLKDHVTARIGYLNITASLPLFIAEEKGFFADKGVLIEAHQIASSNQLVDGIVAGNLDVFVEASAVPVLAVELQSPGRLKVFSVSSITKQAPFDTLLVKEGSSIKSLQDLAGKKIGVFPGSTATNLLRKFLADRGIDVSKITFVPVPPQNHLTVLLGGSVDAVHAYEPTIAIALSHGGVRQLYGSVYAEMLDRNPQGVAVVSSKFIDEHSETAKKVIGALERAIVFMREHEVEARQILAKRMNLEAPAANRSIFLYMIPHREIDVSILQRYADMLTELGELKSRVEVDNLLYHD